MGAGELQKRFRSELDDRGNRVLVEVKERRRPVLDPSRPENAKTNARQADPLTQAPGGRSIRLAGQALEALFQGISRPYAIDMNPIAQASGEVIDAIAEIGLAKWLDTVRAHHVGTFQHCLLVTGLATSFGVKNRMRRADVERLTTGALLHDIGKAKIPLSILDKPGALDARELEVMQRHPVIGYDYLRQQSQISGEVLSMVRSHHEYLDGSGYPDGLMADRIDDVTRILTICDIYGALVEQRAYKAPKTPDEAMAILSTLASQGKVETSLVKAL